LKIRIKRKKLMNFEMH